MTDALPPIQSMIHDSSSGKAGRKPRVLFIGPVSPPVTGQSLACDVLLEALKAEYEIDLVNLSNARLDNSSLRYRHVLSIFGKLWRIWQLKRWSDVIYFTTAESAGGNLKDVLIYAACTGKLKQTVMHLHGGAGMRRLLRGRRGIFRALNRPFVSRLNAVIVLGERLRDVFRDLVPQSRLRIVANFSESQFFTTQTAIEGNFSQLDPVRMLFLSNMLPGKGHLEIVDAYKRLSDVERSKVQIDFAGRFDSEADKASFLSSVEAHPNLQYRGVVTGAEKQALLRDAHVFLLPTYYPYEGQPISILEAFASGCAVVTTDHSGVFDTFTDGVNGVAVEKQSVESLTFALKKIVGNPSAMFPMAITNLTHARTHFTVQRYTSDMLAIFASVANRR